MKRNQTSGGGGIKLIGLIIILAGLLILLDPESVISNGERGVVKESEGWIFILVGSVLLILQFGWQSLMKKLNEDKNIPNLLQIKTHNSKRNYFYTLWVNLPVIILIFLFTVFGPSDTPWTGFFKVMSGYLLFVLSGIWLFQLIRLVLKRSQERDVEQILNWGKSLSYEEMTDGSFHFPTKIFDYGTNGKVEYLLKKSIAGMSVGIFKYSHTQKTGNNSVAVSYSVVNIETLDELPSFNLALKITPKENELDISVGETEKRINEEISNASKINFTTATNDVFCLNVSQKFEIEALQIFQQDIIEEFGKNWPHFIIIGEGKNLIAITTEVNNTEENFKVMANLADFLVENIATKISLIGKSVEEMKEVMKKQQY